MVLNPFVEEIQMKDNDDHFYQASAEDAIAAV